MIAYRVHRIRPLQPAGSARRSVAVPGFRNVSGKQETSRVSTALAEMLATELAAGGRLRTIPGESVARMKAELAPTDNDSLAADTLARIRRDLGTDFVVLGSYTDLGAISGGSIRVDLRLQDARAGELIASVAETGTEAKLFDLVTHAGAVLREKLGAGEITASDAERVRGSIPSDSEAARLYAEVWRACGCLTA